MNRSRWIIATLLIVMAIAMIYVSSDPEMSSRYAQAVRDAELSTEAKDLVMGGIVIVIVGLHRLVLLDAPGMTLNVCALWGSDEAHELTGGRPERAAGEITTRGRGRGEQGRGHQAVTSPAERRGSTCPTALRPVACTSE